MSNILNLTLKKDVFESIRSGVSNDIFIEKTPYWEKRLTTPEGEFKSWDIVRISSGSQEKLDYPIQTIALNIENQYMITVLRDANVVVGGDTDDINIVVERSIDKIEQTLIVHKDGYVTPTTEVKELLDEDVKKPYKERINELLDDFCKNQDVYVVHNSQVTIATDGRILGTNRRLNFRGDNDARIDLRKDTIIKLKWMDDEQYVNLVSNELKKYLKSNYVFIWKSGCEWNTIFSGETELVIRIATVRKYNIPR